MSELITELKKNTEKNMSEKKKEIDFSEQVTAVLERGARFEGKLSFEGTVQIGGEFKGEIFTSDTIIINKGAFVKAEIEANNIIINGHVEGNLFARKKIIMHPPASFRGTVTTPSLRIDEGVVFEGSSYMPDPTPSVNITN